MKFLIVILLLILFIKNGSLQHTHVEGEKTDCEPVLEKGPEYWRGKYSMIDARGFIYNLLSVSKFLLPNTTIDPTVPIGRNPGNYFRFLFLYQEAQILPFRINSHGLIIFNFIRGDAAVIHTIDPKTKKYAATELGYHTNEYTVAIPSGVWYSLDIKTHTKDMFVLMSSTLVILPNGEYSYRFSNRNIMVQNFPQHESIINQLY